MQRPMSSPFICRAGGGMWINREANMSRAITQVKTSAESLGQGFLSGNAGRNSPSANLPGAGTGLLDAGAPGRPGDRLPASRSAEQGRRRGASHRPSPIEAASRLAAALSSDTRAGKDPGTRLRQISQPQNKQRVLERHQRPMQKRPTAVGHLYAEIAHMHRESWRSFVHRTAVGRPVGRASQPELTQRLRRLAEGLASHFQLESRSLARRSELRRLLSHFARQRRNRSPSDQPPFGRPTPTALEEKTLVCSRADARWIDKMSKSAVYRTMGSETPRNQRKSGA